MGDAVLDIYAINLELGAMAVCTGVWVLQPSCTYSYMLSPALHITMPAWTHCQRMEWALLLQAP